MSSTSLVKWFKSNSVILFNTGSLMGTMLVTSGLGFAYWIVAARYFPSEAVGLASAATSAMMLLSTLLMLGQGTLLISELPRNKDQRGSIISASLLVVGTLSLVGGGIFAILTPVISPQLRALGTSPQTIALFALGVSFTSITLIIDYAMIGMLRSSMQLWRNTLFAVAKLVLLFVAGSYLAKQSGISIYTVWTLGNIISLLPVLFFIIKCKKWSLKYYIPQWQLMRKLGKSAIQHHALNLILQAPTQALPILVTILLSAQANAWFYIASMIANFIFSLSGSLTTVLHAANSAQPSTLTQKTRLTTGLSLISSFTLGSILMFGAEPILHAFGSSYATQASPSLRILLLAAVPLIIKNHYIAICRIKDQVHKAILPVSIGSVLQLAIAALGARQMGLIGLSFGWVIALSVEALLMLPIVFKTLLGQSAIERHLETIANSDTVLLPALNQFAPSGIVQLSTFGNTMALTELDTLLMPAIRKSTVQTADKKAATGKNGTTKVLHDDDSFDQLLDARIKKERVAVVVADIHEFETAQLDIQTLRSNAALSDVEADLLPVPFPGKLPDTPPIEHSIPPIEDEQSTREESIDKHKEEQLDFSGSPVDEDRQVAFPEPSDDILQIDFPTALPETPFPAAIDNAEIHVETEDEEAPANKKADIAAIHTLHIQSIGPHNLFTPGSPHHEKSDKREQAEGEEEKSAAMVEDLPTMAMVAVSTQTHKTTLEVDREEQPTMMMAKLPAQTLTEQPTMMMVTPAQVLVEEMPTAAMQKISITQQGKLSWIWPAIIVCMMLMIVFFVLIIPGTPVQPLIVISFLLIGPGMAWLPLLRLEDKLVEITLGLAVGLSIDALVTGYFLYTRFWSPPAIMITLCSLSVLGIALQSYQLLQNRKPAHMSI